MTSGKEITEEFPGGHAKIIDFSKLGKQDFQLWIK